MRMKISRATVRQRKLQSVTAQRPGLPGGEEFPDDLGGLKLVTGATQDARQAEDRVWNGMPAADNSQQLHGLLSGS